MTLFDALVSRVLPGSRALQPLQGPSVLLVEVAQLSEETNSVQLAQDRALLGPERLSSMAAASVPPGIGSADPPTASMANTSVAPALWPAVLPTPSLPPTRAVAAEDARPAGKVESVASRRLDEAQRPSLTESNSRRSDDVQPKSTRVVHERVEVFLPAVQAEQMPPSTSLQHFISNLDHIDAPQVQGAAIAPTASKNAASTIQPRVAPSEFVAALSPALPLQGPPLLQIAIDRVIVRAESPPPSRAPTSPAVGSDRLARYLAERSGRR